MLLKGLLGFAAALACHSCAHRDTGHVFISEMPHEEAVADPRYARSIEKSRRLVLEVLKMNALPGAQLAIAIDGEVRWSENFGFSDVGAQERVKAGTLFRIGSLSKSLTALAVGKLKEQGKLNIDAPISQYLSGLPASYRAITTRQLATHQAGVRHYYGADLSTKHEAFPDVRDALKLFIHTPLLFEPGRNFSYSTYGWVLTSAVVQQACGKKFQAYMQQDVFTPLGMVHTFAEVPREKHADVSTFYVRSHSGFSWQEAPPEDLSFKLGGAGFYSNANDLAAMGAALLKGGFLRKETVSSLFEVGRTVSGASTGYGIGWYLLEFGEERIVASSGSMSTAKAHLMLFPESNIVIAFVANSGDIVFEEENLVYLADIFGQEKKDKNAFVFSVPPRNKWKGMWRIEHEGSTTRPGDAFLYFFNDNTLRFAGRMMEGQNPPVHLEVTQVTDSSIRFIAPFEKYTADFTLVLSGDTLKGVRRIKKPINEEMKRVLHMQDELSDLLRPKTIAKGYKL
jgi:CubicO group peptidase (beta-lactamase class C family)